jgi:type 2 lantibiotic biosynthesis protein LanM
MVSLQRNNEIATASEPGAIAHKSAKRKLSESDLIEIVEQASTIAERLSPDFEASSTIDENEISRRLERWYQVVAQGDVEQFNKRLAWDNLDLDTVKAVLGKVKLTQPASLPQWAKTLKASLESSFDLKAVRTPDESKQEPIPFEALYLPFVAVASQRLRQVAGSSYDRLNSECHKTLKLDLLSKLSGLCSKAMELEFKAFRAYQQQVSTISKTRWFGQFPGSQSTKQYDAFVTEMQSGKLLSFFQEYSVLGRLMGTLIDFWVDAIAEFLTRLDTDWAGIEEIFGSESSLDKVVGIRPFLSDRHHQGRTVFAIQFASDLKLIYKPKDIGQEANYFQLLDWLNQHGSPLPFKLFKTFNRSTHGWVEYVEQLPCQSPEEAQRYYQRAGMLLCLLYVIEGTDVHHENIVACGEHPVLVDMETLFHHRIKEMDSLGDSALDLANEQMQNSVLRTYMLPRWEFGIDGQSYDISGLGGFGGRETPLLVPKWSNLNTDAMKLTYEKFITKPSNNVPFLDGKPLPASLYIEDLVKGFRQMYNFWLTNKETLLAPDSPFSQLAPQRVRFIFRHTKIYASVSRTVLSPQYLKNGVDRSIEMEVLSLAMLKAANPPVFWPLFHAEKESLEQLDIPMFVASSDSDCLVLDDGQKIDSCFAQSSNDLVGSRIQKLDEQDLETQVGYIWGTIQASSMEDSLDITGNLVPPALELSDSLIDLVRVENLTSDALVEYSVQIAQELKQKAIYTSEGSATWISLIYQPDAQQYEMLPMGLRLFDGCSGVAMFLAGLTKITNSKSHRDLALATLNPLLRKINDCCDRLTQELGIGGGMGAGGFIYSLVKSGQMLGEDFLEPAKQVAVSITEERIADDRKFDILGGSAGAILGLLTLYQVQPTEEILEQAIACGGHLLEHRVKSESGHRAWMTGKQTMLTGFSHGAAGIAYALARLFEVTQKEEFLIAALESNAYEANVFIPEQNNWPDFRYPPTEKGYSCWNSWCHGASGIGMARIAELDILPADTIQFDIEAAIATTKEYPLERIDQLCCGNLGRTEFLLNAAQKLDRLDLKAIAHQRISQVAARATSKGKFGLNWETGPYDPSFFQGSSGIGYQLLRMAYPDLLPSVLVWE